jgi:hypothetical protein
MHLALSTVEPQLAEPSNNAGCHIDLQFGFAQKQSLVEVNLPVYFLVSDREEVRLLRARRPTSINADCRHLD